MAEFFMEFIFKETYVPYKVKIWYRIYFGGLANYENPPN